MAIGTAALTDQDIAALRRIAEEDWPTACLARNWDRALQMCTGDVVFMSPDAPAIRGHTAFREWLDAFPPVLKMSQTMESARGQGDFAVVRGAMSITVEVEGQEISNTGKWLCLFEKQPDGSWRFSEDAFNWDQPMPA